MIPLALYSLEYPKLALVLNDFRGKLNERRHQVTQRSINELTAGVLGLTTPSIHLAEKPLPLIGNASETRL